MEYVAALGTPVERFSELQQCYRQTNLCFSRRYSVERNQILEEETPGETAAEVLEDVKLGELNISSLCQRQAEAFCTRALGRRCPASWRITLHSSGTAM